MKKLILSIAFLLCALLPLWAEIDCGCTNFSPYSVVTYWYVSDEFDDCCSPQLGLAEKTQVNWTPYGMTLPSYSWVSISVAQNACCD